MDEHEKRAEELLQHLGETLAEKHKAAMEPIDCSEIREVVSSKRDAGKKQSKMRHLRQICAILICCVLLAAGITTVSSDAVRAKLFGFLFNEKEGHSDLVRQDSSSSPKVMYPKYLPEGYEKTSEEDIGVGTQITYTKGTQEVIVLTQITDPDVEESIDTETTKRERCLVNDNEGYFLSGDETHVLIWEKSGVYMKLISTLDKQTMIRIGSSIT